MEMDLTMAGPPTSDDETDINLQKPIEDTWQEHAVVVSKSGRRCLWSALMAIYDGWTGRRGAGGGPKAPQRPTALAPTGHPAS